MRLVLVAAVAENGVIGRDGAMPWRLASDLARFKALTSGHPVVMGRATFAALGRPLAGRANIVVSRSGAVDATGIAVAPSIEAALELADDEAGRTLNGRIFVIGGGQVFAATIGRADGLCITHVEAAIDGDTVFPEIEAGRWTPTGIQRFPAGPRDSHATRYVVYRRRCGDEFTKSA